MESAIHKDDRWKEQYQRIRRWYEKIQKIDYLDELRKKQYESDNVLLAMLFFHQNSITEEGLDILYAFFINCFHLSDWLIHSKVLSRDIVNDFFRNNEAMKLCHIICIGSKHLEITNPQILDTTKYKYGTIHEYDPSRSNTTAHDGSVKTRLIHINRNIYDMMDIAKESMDAIDKFLYTNNLLEDKWNFETEDKL